MKLLSLHTLLLSLPSLYAFSSVNRPTRRRVGWIAASSRLSAVIYQPSFDDEPTASSFEVEEPQIEAGDSSPKDLMQFLSTESMASLARLAVAFCPPGQGLNIKDIEQVQVLSVHEDHLDIEAVVCEFDGCVTLAVPIKFPSSCQDRFEKAFTDCVLENVNHLDNEAVEVLRVKDWEEANPEQVREAAEVAQALKSTDDVFLPDWWVLPGVSDAELREECDSVRELLNENDFSGEVRALASRALHTSNPEWQVDQAAVVAVGPAGLVVRANAKESASAKLEQVEVPIVFGDTMTDAESLRAAVLGAVAQAGDYVQG